MEKIREEDERLLKEGIKIVSFEDPLYPQLLKNIADPPPCLFVKGNLEVFEKPSLAIVGSRNATIYGLNVAETFAKDLVLNGMSIVSGLARGIDSAAHKGSLAVEKAQIAVLGTGIDTIYPPENKELYDKIIQKGGAIITEFPPNTPPLKRNFPQRNRIIAGVAFGTLIVEAEEFSGSLVTGRFTLETGRELFCIPHNITTKSGVGPNYLIQKGAKLVMRAEDIIEEVPDYLKKKLIRYNNGLLEGETLPENLTEEEKKVLNLLKFDEEKSIDALCELSGLSIGKLLSAAASLKIKGLLNEHPGGRYSRKKV